MATRVSLGLSAYVLLAIMLPLTLAARHSSQGLVEKSDVMAADAVKDDAGVKEKVTHVAQEEATFVPGIVPSLPKIGPIPKANVKPVSLPRWNVKPAPVVRPPSIVVGPHSKPGLLFAGVSSADGPDPGDGKPPYEYTEDYWKFLSFQLIDSANVRRQKTNTAIKNVQSVKERLRKVNDQLQELLYAQHILTLAPDLPAHVTEVYFMLADVKGLERARTRVSELETHLGAIQSSMLELEGLETKLLQADIMFHRQVRRLANNLEAPDPNGHLQAQVEAIDSAVMDWFVPAQFDGAGSIIAKRAALGKDDWDVVAESLGVVERARGSLDLAVKKAELELGQAELQLRKH